MKSTKLQRDRLSALPESLIVGILSFLEFKEAVKTCVLSKQWRSVWTQLPTLEFKERSSKSVEIVNRLIAVGGIYGVKTFSVELDYQTRFASDVNAWIEFAAANKVENLSLCLHATEPTEELFLPPPCLGWRCLRSLSLGGVRFASQEHLDNLLSRCPVLETLELIKCKGFHRVDVGNPSFRRLRVVSIRDLGTCYLREISAEHMRELEVSTNTSLRVTNAPSLQQASIDIPIYYDGLQHTALANILKLFEDIRHVNKLELSGISVHVISEMYHHTVIEFPQFMRLQNLKICAANSHISGIGTLLRSSPNLDNLLISCLSCLETDVSEMYNHPGIQFPQFMRLQNLKICAANGDIYGSKALLRSSSLDFESFLIPRLETHEFASHEMDKRIESLHLMFVKKWSELLHLKFVDMAFTGSTTLVLAKTILKKAPVLEQMVIRNASSSSRNSRYFNEKFEDLLRYPKSSKGAKLLIH